MIEAISSGQAQLAVERLGNGPTPAVALHAGVADRRSWRELAAALDGEVGLVAYDRRGFGDTGCVSEPFRHVDDLLAVLDAVLPGERPWLIGNSQGGAVALDLALHAPDRVAGLVLIAAAVSGDEEVPDEGVDPRALELDAAIEAADERGDLDEVNRLEAHFWLDGPLEPEGRVSGETRALFLDMNGRALRAADPGEELPPHGGPALRRLGEVAVPTLVVWGDLDVSVVADRARALLAGIAGAEPVLVPGTAHLPQLERPGAVAEVVRARFATSG